MARRRLGEVLLARGAITKAQLEEALAYARRTRQRLGGALVQKGHLSEEALVHALSESLGLAAVDLERVFVDWNAVQLLRSGVCEAYGLFPYAIETLHGRRQLLVAMVDPLNLSAVEEVEFTTAPSCVEVVSTTGGVPVTSTVSVDPPTCKGMSRVTTSFRFTTMPLRAMALS